MLVVHRSLDLRRTDNVDTGGGRVVDQSLITENSKYIHIDKKQRNAQKQCIIDVVCWVQQMLYIFICRPFQG